MQQSLQDIFLLEDSDAFEAYNKLYLLDKSEYEVWKHFYFFLWLALEEGPSFVDRTGLQHLLQSMFNEGKQAFSNEAGFNFIAGYTVSIFPYEYGDYESLYKEAQQMLLKATVLQPDNLIYQLAYRGSITDADKELTRQIEVSAAPKVLDTFGGTSAFDKYFLRRFYTSRTRKP